LPARLRLEMRGDDHWCRHRVELAPGEKFV
jgi:hypothetical protein